MPEEDDSNQEKPKLTETNAEPESGPAKTQELMQQRPEAISLYNSKWSNWALAN